MAHQMVTSAVERILATATARTMTAEYRYTTDRAAWEREVLRLHSDGGMRGRIVAVEVVPASVSVEYRIGR
jgi:hypothetical protein